MIVVEIISTKSVICLFFLFFFFATVKFVCEIISVKKNQENKIIEGNPDKIKTVTDYWKFSKNSLTQSPNWYLAEIISK